jgi:hypothetical protein
MHNAKTIETWRARPQQLSRPANEKTNANIAFPPQTGNPGFGLPVILADSEGHPHPARLELLLRFAIAAMETLIVESYRPDGGWLDAQNVAMFAYEYAFAMLDEYDRAIAGVPS